MGHLDGCKPVNECLWLEVNASCNVKVYMVKSYNDKGYFFSQLQKAMC